MKKVLFATGVAALVFASVVSAQGYQFNSNLTVGSTGSDVVALQTWLIANGYSIPSITSGAAAKGYFGSQTQAAVQQYQAAHGVPSTGFFGPLTRAALNSGSSVATGSSAMCPAGYVCTPSSAGTVITGGVSGGITTPGVTGIMTVTTGPLSSSVLNVGAQNVALETVRVQAQYSDIDVQSITLDLGNNTAIYNKILSSLEVTDGTNVLATVPLNGSTVVQSGTEYIVGVSGFHFVVPHGSYKDLIIKANLNTSIDSAYIGSGAKVPQANTINNQNIGNGYGIGVVANGVRGVDGAGLNLYGPATGISQIFTINQSLTDNAQANISLDPSSPLVASIPVSDTTNSQYLGLPIFTFDVNAQNDTLHIHQVKVGIQTTGTGSVGAAYLFQGSTQIASASVVNGAATFTNITDGTAGATIPVNSTVPFTVKADVTGVTSGTLAVIGSVATTSSSDLSIYNSIDGTATISGSALGNTQTVSSAGPLFTLVGTPTITKANISAGNSTDTLFQYTATFNVNVQAIGQNVIIGLPSSTTPKGASFGTSTTGINIAQIYQDGTATSSQSVIASYSQPTNTTLNSGGADFTVSRNQSVTIPVTYSFTVLNPGAHTYAVQLQGIYTNGSVLTNFMMNQPAYRTSAI